MLCAGILMKYLLLLFITSPILTMDSNLPMDSNVQIPSFIKKDGSSIVHNKPHQKTFTEAINNVIVPIAKLRNIIHGQTKQFNTPKKEGVSNKLEDMQTELSELREVPAINDLMNECDDLYKSLGYYSYEETIEYYDNIIKDYQADIDFKNKLIETSGIQQEKQQTQFFKERLNNLMQLLGYENDIPRESNQNAISNQQASQSMMKTILDKNTEKINEIKAQAAEITRLKGKIKMLKKHTKELKTNNLGQKSFSPPDQKSSNELLTLNGTLQTIINDLVAERFKLYALYDDVSREKWTLLTELENYRSWYTSPATQQAAQNHRRLNQEYEANVKLVSENSILKLQNNSLLQENNLLRTQNNDWQEHFAFIRTYNPMSRCAPQNMNNVVTDNTTMLPIQTNIDVLEKKNESNTQEACIKRLESNLVDANKTIDNLQDEKNIRISEDLKKGIAIGLFIGCAPLFYAGYKKYFD